MNTVSSAKKKSSISPTNQRNTNRHSKSVLDGSHCYPKVTSFTLKKSSESETKLPLTNLAATTASYTRTCDNVRYHAFMHVLSVWGLGSISSVLTLCLQHHQVIHPTHLSRSTWLWHKSYRFPIKWQPLWTLSRSNHSYLIRSILTASPYRWLKVKDNGLLFKHYTS